MCSFKMHIISVQSKTNTLGSPKSMATYKTCKKTQKQKYNNPCTDVERTDSGQRQYIHLDQDHISFTQL